MSRGANDHYDISALGWNAGVSTPGSVGRLRSLTLPAELSAPGVEQPIIADMNGDGLPDLVWLRRGIVYSLPQPTVDRLQSISEGQTEATSYSVSYAPLSDSRFYGAPRLVNYQYGMRAGSVPCIATATTNCALGGTALVVSQHSADAGLADVSARRVFQYRYENGRYDTDGRGWLGFERMLVTDGTTGFVTISTYDNSTWDAAHKRYPYLGMILSIWKDGLLDDGQYHLQRFLLNLARQDQVGANGASYSLPFVSRRLEEAYQLVSSIPGVRTSWSETVEDFEQAVRGGSVTPYRRADAYISDTDGFGNPTRWVADFGDGYSDTIQATYRNDFARWIVARPITLQVTSTTPGGTAQRTSIFDYDEETGYLWKHLVEPRLPERLVPQLDWSPLHRVAAPQAHPLTLQTTYAADGYGNPTSILLRDSLAMAGAPGGEQRLTILEYDDDPERMSPTRIVSPQGHQTKRLYHPVFGKVIVEQDANALSTRWAYRCLRPAGFRGASWRSDDRNILRRRGPAPAGGPIRRRSPTRREALQGHLLRSARPPDRRPLGHSRRQCRSTAPRLRPPRPSGQRDRAARYGRTVVSNELCVRSHWAYPVDHPARRRCHSPLV